MLPSLLSSLHSKMCWVPLCPLLSSGRAGKQTLTTPVPQNAASDLGWLMPYQVGTQSIRDISKHAGVLKMLLHISEDSIGGVLWIEVVMGLYDQGHAVFFIKQLTGFVLWQGGSSLRFLLGPGRAWHGGRPTPRLRKAAAFGPIPWP